MNPRFLTKALAVLLLLAPGASSQESRGTIIGRVLDPSGAVVNVSTKSGTNALHGTSYYFDSRIRSVPWFSNRWLYDTSTGPITPEKREQAEPKWLFRRWGDTFNGPVVLPRLYNGRNGTFWSFGAASPSSTSCP